MNWGGLLFISMSIYNKYIYLLHSLTSLHGHGADYTTVIVPGKKPEFTVDVLKKPEFTVDVQKKPEFTVDLKKPIFTKDVKKRNQNLQ